jgi:hypothetical protein
MFWANLTPFSPKENGSAPQLASKRKQTIAIKGLAVALAPFRRAKKIAMGPAHLLEKSAKLLKHNDPSHQANNPSYDADAAALAMMQDRASLIFAEYVFLMRAGALAAWLPGNWQEWAEDMHKLREAFDAADVDGDNQLELEELEMCIVSMNPKVEVEHADIVQVWKVLNPEGKDWIAYAEFVKGMISVKRDHKELSRSVPMDVPNRFMLLSLLIDTPINEEATKLIMDRLGRAEQAGIRYTLCRTVCHSCALLSYCNNRGCR